METQLDGNGDKYNIKETREKLESRIGTLHNAQLDLIASLQTLVPDIVSSLDLSLKVVSSFNGRPFTPIPTPLPHPNPNSITNSQDAPEDLPKTPNKSAGEVVLSGGGEKFTIDESGGPLSVVRSMVAVCLLERVPFTEIDSSSVLSKLESDQSATGAEKAALREMGGDSGAILAVEMALRSMAEDNGGVQLEEFKVGGKSRVLVKGIDRTRLVKELPESKQFQQNDSGSSSGNQVQQLGTMPRPMGDIWMGGQGDPHLSGMPQFFPVGGGPGGMMGPRGGGPRGMMGMMGMPRGMGVPPMHRAPMGMNAQIGGGSNMKQPRTEEDDLKDLEDLLNKKSFRELQKSKTGEELLDLIRRPTAKETAVAAKVVPPPSLFFITPRFLMQLPSFVFHSELEM